MLPPRHRMRRSQDFTDAVRGGVRGKSHTVVVHLWGSSEADSEPAIVGLVVGKMVGNAVERNQVKRRLRGVLTGRIASLESGAKMVVRALPAARAATSAVLAKDLDVALQGARRRSRATQGAQ